MESPSTPTAAMPTSTETSSAPTGFLDLPPELRNNIYELAIDDIPAAYPVILNHLRLPALSQVSRQIRQEFVPLYLSGSELTTIIGADFKVRNRVRKQGYPSDPYERQFLDRVTQDSGRIVLPPFALLPERAPLFRWVEFSVSKGDVVRYVRTEAARTGGQDESDAWRLMRDCGLLLRWTPKRGLDVISCLHRWMNDDEERDGIYAVLELATSMAKDMAKREGFKGFSLRDLEEVAAVFRYGDCHGSGWNPFSVHSLK